MRGRPMTDEQIKKARELLEARWSDSGECRSCGWHAALYEHRVTDYDIAEALDDDGVLRLVCLSDDEDRARHRGVKVNLLPESVIGND